LPLRDEENKPLPNGQYDKPEKLLAEAKCETPAAIKESRVCIDLF
jgi:hypothetical protein